ncbi:transketolase [Burkholderiales bacterium GJ-E10]|nr:transketolase [Burkholderiales bacterium GJ-E10]
MTHTNQEVLAANALRMLAVDAVQKANSGHPGMPMGMAEIAVALWGRHLQHNPANPSWFNRDRFVLSNGHGSMLLYSLLHLSGYDLPMEELKRFRQLHSKAPGHPEVGMTPGVETTTGPLGQGVANAVGMAMAERILAQRFNKPDATLVDHHTYVFLGDGCLMEGVSHEACSLAGTLKLNKLICLYDDNGISIDGKVEGWFSDDTLGRFRAYGWNAERVDGHDVNAVSDAIARARKSDKPTMIACRTIIGKGSPDKAGTAGVHGAALGVEGVAKAREALHWPYAPFEIPSEAYSFFDARARGQSAEGAWNEKLAAYRKAYPEDAAEFDRWVSGKLPAAFSAKFGAYIEETIAKGEKLATRQASQRAIAVLAAALPELVGGSADLTESNLTHWKEAVSFTPDRPGNYLHYGVREFGMSAAVNGMALHGGLIPFGSTFLVFSDYARNAIRMSALMHQRVIYVFTHDSIGLGEDGPTHQPIEHVASLRMIPNVQVWRPCDVTEAAIAWRHGIERTNGPTVLALTRQALPAMVRNDALAAGAARGGYVLHEPSGKAQVALLATGSEVSIAMDAAKALEAEGIAARVVSMPCLEVFEQQDAAYRKSVLGEGLPRVAVEAGVSNPWYRYVGENGRIVGIDRFGESAPAGELFKYFGLTADRVAAEARALLGK